MLKSQNVYMLHKLCIVYMVEKNMRICLIVIENFLFFFNHYLQKRWIWGVGKKGLLNRAGDDGREI